MVHACAKRVGMAETWRRTISASTPSRRLSQRQQRELPRPILFPCHTINNPVSFQCFTLLHQARSLIAEFLSCLCPSLPRRASLPRPSSLLGILNRSTTALHLPFDALT